MPDAPHPAPPSPVPRGQATVVPILGMHRSGTSMFTRAMNLLGLALGEPLMKPQADNPKGFWENEFFYEIDLRILRAVGCHVSGYGTRDALLRVPDLSYRVERRADNLAVLEDYLAPQFGAHRTWGWKDPRSVLVFPFWLTSLVELGYRDVRPAVISRHPASVVHSLARRTDLGALAPAAGCSVEELGLQMWTAYSHILLDVIDATDPFVSLHEWYLEEDSAREELLRGAAYLDLPVAGPDLAQALRWLDPGAVHHREPGPLDGLRGAEEALRLHEDLCGRARAQRAAWRRRAAA